MTVKIDYSNPGLRSKAMCVTQDNVYMEQGSFVLMSQSQSICDWACENQPCERKLHLVRYS